jgi:CheY-like chemotaxis protein
MAFPALSFRRPAISGDLDLARVLVVHHELPSRLTLQTILRAGGYAVEVAASASEGLSKLDDGVFDLVLTAPDVGARGAGAKVLAYARVKDYHPATALVSSYATAEVTRQTRQPQLAIYTENIPTLLAKVAELIGMRASRRAERNTRQPTPA